MPPRNQGVCDPFCPCSVVFGRQISALFLPQRQRENGSLLVQTKDFASRDIAPCCARIRHQVVAIRQLSRGIPIKQRALKAQNVWHVESLKAVLARRKLDCMGALDVGSLRT
jgi:hypothetical protein